MLCLIVVALNACTSVTSKRPPYNDPSDDASIKLAEAANSVSDSMLQMAKTEKILTPPQADNVLTIPNTNNLNAHASVDWSGPIQEVTKRIAEAANYNLRVLGTEPAIPVLVSINLKDYSLGDILRYIDYQAANKASIHVYPNSKVVELRYVNPYA